MSHSGHTSDVRHLLGAGWRHITGTMELSCTPPTQGTSQLALCSSQANWGLYCSLTGGTSVSSPGWGCELVQKGAPSPGLTAIKSRIIQSSLCPSPQWAKARASQVLVAQHGLVSHFPRQSHPTNKTSAAECNIWELNAAASETAHAWAKQSRTYLAGPPGPALTLLGGRSQWV